jgi:predicted kinase
MGRAHGCEVEAVFFDVPLAVCRERNARRRRVVPEEALAKMAGKLTPPTVEEGFARVTLIRD